MRSLSRNSEELIEQRQTGSAFLPAQGNFPAGLAHTQPEQGLFMALEWIKMRADLVTHPRFLSLCAGLIASGLRRYVSGSDDGTVTESALRDVTLVALMRVWHAVNAHCKVDGDDAVMPMSITRLDEIAGFSGFAFAMMEAGWAQEDGKCVRFPNFLEFNEPVCLRVIVKTNADRQRAYRERHKNHVTESNASITRSNGREENRREQKRTEEKNEKANCPEPAEPASVQQDFLPLEPSLMVFPTVGKGNKEWSLTQSVVDQLQEAFPSLLILAEARKALEWCRANSAKRKTPGGMRKFLYGWMERAQNTNRGSKIASSGNEDLTRKVDLERTRKLLEERQR